MYAFILLSLRAEPMMGGSFTAVQEIVVVSLGDYHLPDYHNMNFFVRLQGEICF